MIKNKIIPVNSIILNGNENKYLKNCIKDNWISSGGKYNYLFEKKIKNHIKKKFAISVTNGTSALETAIQALNLKSLKANLNHLRDHPAVFASSKFKDFPGLDACLYKPQLIKFRDYMRALGYEADITCVYTKSRETDFSLALPESHREVDLDSLDNDSTWLSNAYKTGVFGWIGDDNDYDIMHYHVSLLYQMPIF